MQRDLDELAAEGLIEMVNPSARPQRYRRFVLVAIAGDESVQDQHPQSHKDPSLPFAEEVTGCREGRQLARSGLGQDPDRWRQRKVLATAKMLATLPQRQNRRRAEHTSLCARIP